MELGLTTYLFCFSAIVATVESSRVPRFGRQTAYNLHQPSHGSGNDNSRPILVFVNSNPSHGLYNRPSSFSSNSEEDLTRSELLMKILRLLRIKPVGRSSNTNNVSHTSKKRPQEVKHNLRTQVLKDLLSLRNSMRCRQQVDCKSKCYRQIAISMDLRQGDGGCDCGCQCEQKYECDVTEDVESSCSSEDNCGFDTNPSTKSFI